MKKLVVNALVVFSAFSILARSWVPASLAEITYEISGNAEGSTNTVSADSQETTTVDQANTGEVQNDVVAETNTGGNSASENSGDVAIETGDSSTSVQVSNALNQNTATIDNCCDGDMTGEISGNGADSTNTLSVTSTSTTTANLTNTTTITNNISISANTGTNSGDANVGNVAITTGNIDAQVSVQNTAGNNTVSVSVSDPSITASIFGNGANSQNSILFSFDPKQEVNLQNFTRVYNKLVLDLNTGKNKAGYNVGDVAIKTGDIVAKVKIENEVNENEAEVDCCPKEVSPTPPPAPSPTPTTPTGGPPGDGEAGPPGGNGDGGNGGGGEAGGVGGGEVLGLSPTGAQVEFLTRLLYILAAASTIASLGLLKGQIPALSALSRSNIICQIKVIRKRNRWQLSLTLKVRPLSQKRALLSPRLSSH